MIVTPVDTGITVSVMVLGFDAVTVVSSVSILVDTNVVVEPPRDVTSVVVSTTGGRVRVTC
jgi:hypothetical protein